MRFFLQLYDIRTYVHLKTYETSKPVNSGAISPIMDHVRNPHESSTLARLKILL